VLFERIRRWEAPASIDGCTNRCTPPIAGRWQDACFLARPCFGRHFPLLFDDDRRAWPTCFEPIFGRVETFGASCCWIRSGRRLTATDNRGCGRARKVPVGCSNRQSRGTGPHGVHSPCPFQALPLSPVHHLIAVRSRNLQPGLDLGLPYPLHFTPDKRDEISTSSIVHAAVHERLFDLLMRTSLGYFLLAVLRAAHRWTLGVDGSALRDDSRQHRVQVTINRSLCSPTHSPVTLA